MLTKFYKIVKYENTYWMPTINNFILYKYVLESKISTHLNYKIALLQLFHKKSNHPDSSYTGDLFMEDNKVSIYFSACLL
jgi:hypothetical protein